ncbi:MAG: class I SAM-dependent methyltransferase [Firmicutes bacterium HGW-Firmicutes-21]|nr:MAG: class I SAM-dependent methyltransferase [Firmicutes bacterium HGW-Firmicutes-21]
MNCFETTAGLYDSINSGQYSPYASFLRHCFNNFSKIKVNEVLDLGCGTGGIARLLSEYGYDMVGVDNSPDMLSVAHSAAKGGGDILYICQDMRELELYGTVQAAYSSFDCLNYLESNTELDCVFALLRNYIETGGLLVFDVNTLYRYDKVFDGNSFVYEFGEDMLVWQNQFSSAKKICDFYLTLFKREKGAYKRFDERQRQKYFPQKTLLSLLRKNGFSVVGIYGSTELTPLEKTSEKAYFLAVAQ